VKRRCTLTLISTAFVWLWIAFPVSNAVAQSAADVEGVKEASKNLYAALAVLDNGEAMERVWAHTPYVTYVGPRHTSVLVGWDAQEKYWPEANALFTQREKRHAVGPAYSRQWQPRVGDGSGNRRTENEGWQVSQAPLSRDECLREDRR